MPEEDMRLVPPGEVLMEEFLKPMGVSQYRRAITADTDLRLCRFFGLSEGFWLRLQTGHDLRVAKQQLGDALSAIQPWPQH